MDSISMPPIEDDRSNLPPLEKPMVRRSFASAFISFSPKLVVASLLLGAAASLGDALLLAGIRGGVELLAADGAVEWGQWSVRPDLQTALYWSLFLTAIILMRFVVGAVRWSRVARHATRFEASVRQALVRAPQPRGGLERLAQRFTHDIVFLRRGGEQLHQLFQALLQLLIFVPWMALLSWELTVLMLLVLAPLVALLQRRIHKVGVPMGAMLSKVDRLGRDYGLWLKLQNNWTLPFSLGVVRERLENQIEELSDDAWKIESRRAKLVGAAELVSGLATLLVLVGSGILLRTGRLSIADLVAFCGALLLCYRPLREGFRLPPILRDSQVSWNRLRSLAATPPLLPREFSLEEAVVSEAVSFSYGSRSLIQEASWKLTLDHPVLLYGPNGSGKSTLLKLMAGLLAPRSGRLLLPNSCRTHDLAYLSQEPVVPRWIPRVYRDSEERVLLEQLQIPISRGSADGILEKGFSGGELQRIALASILLQPSKLVLLDEPVSKLPASERAATIQAIRQFCRAKGRHLIISSHEIYADFSIVDIATLRGRS